MKKKLVIPSLMATVGLMALAGEAKATLIHEYTFNSGTVAVDSIAGADGALIGGAAIVSEALSLNGSSSYSETIGNHIVPTSGDFTVSFFAKQTAFGPTHVELISQGQSGNGFYIGYDTNHNIRITDANTSTSIAFPADGLYHNYALTYSGGSANFYIDGVLAGTFSALAVGPGGTDTRFGAQFEEHGEFFNGFIDNVRIYDTALSATEIATISAVPVPDLSITKSHKGDFLQGEIGATYSIRVSNVGTSSTTGTVTMTDTLPTGLMAAAISGNGWNCDLGTLTCTRNDILAVGASFPLIKLTANVASDAPSSVTNTATVSGGGEVNTSNDTALDPTIITPAFPDLTVTKKHKGNFKKGQTGTYAITVINAGTSATTGTVTVTDNLPTGLTATAVGGTGWSCNLGTLSCTRNDTLAVGASYPQITLTANVANNAPTSVTNTATVSGGGEVNTSNDTTSDLATIK